MKLKYQLLFLALLSLLFPITGWFALKSVDKEFRLSIEQASQNTLSSLQASILQILKSNSEIKLDGLVLGKLNDIAIDGYDSEWLDINAYKYINAHHQLTVQIATFNNNLALYITSNDKNISVNPVDIFENDYVLIGLVNNRGLHQYKYYRQGEGEIQAEHISTDGPSNQAYWHETANGYTLEILFDDDKSHHLGFANLNFINKTARIDETIKTMAGTLVDDNHKTLKLLPIVSNNKKLEQIISDITPVNNKFTIRDKENRLIYQSDKLPKNHKVSAWQWMITPIYQWLFVIDNSKNDNSADNKWFYRKDDGMAGIKQTIIEDNISYELKSMMPQGQQNMIQTLLKAGVLMIAVVLLLMLAYLGYSLFLAWRIKKLNRALQSVLDDSGRMTVEMPSHKSSDEIGELSRGIETMLREMREYTQYLKDLGSRLSHEMKTPLAIVQSSLDNLEMENLEMNNDPEFLLRAQDGTKRLRFILNQLGELSQLKYTLEQTPKEKFDLSELIQQLASSYQSIVP
ncbi:MAG: hypothetical protein L3J83_08530, partial [Proteobacteria bacterium]|nr:hypothetical protein [Pseudomonadota bacterium]